MRRKVHFAGLVVVIFLAVPCLCAADFDQTHTRWSMILKQVVQDGLVDYVYLVRNPSELDTYIKDFGRLKKADYENFSVNQKIAYWVNLYNAGTVWAIAKNYPVVPKKRNSLYPKNSVRQIPGVWTTLMFKTALGQRNLGQVEAEQIRGFNNPLLIFLLSNGSKSAPKIQPMAIHPERVDQQLDDAIRNFVLDVKNVRADPGAKRLYLSPFFRWNANLFVPRYYKPKRYTKRTKTDLALLAFLNEQAGLMVKMMILKNEFSIRYLEYDWSLNER